MIYRSVFLNDPSCLFEVDAEVLHCIMSHDLLVYSVCSVSLVLWRFPAKSKHRALISYHLPVEKKKKDLHHLKNWRPVTLLYNDIKPKPKH